MREKIIYRLDRSQLAAVQRAAGLTHSVNSASTPIEVACQLGMARVIEILRNGWEVHDDAPTADKG